MTTRAHDVVHTIIGSNHGSSAKAVRFTVTHIGTYELDKPKTEWFPLSQVVSITTDKNLDKQDTLVVSEWILKQKELL